MMVSGAQGTPFTCTQASSLALSYHLNSLFYAVLWAYVFMMASKFAAFILCLLLHACKDELTLGNMHDEHKW
jgi:hypothetical protein